MKALILTFLGLTLAAQTHAQTKTDDSKEIAMTITPNPYWHSLENDLRKLADEEAQTIEHTIGKAVQARSQPRIVSEAANMALNDIIDLYVSVVFKVLAPPVHDQPTPSHKGIVFYALRNTMKGLNKLAAAQNQELDAFLQTAVSSADDDTLEKFINKSIAFSNFINPQVASVIKEFTFKGNALE